MIIIGIIVAAGALFALWYFYLRKKWGAPPEPTIPTKRPRRK